MFAVDIEMDNKIKTYYVWGKGELIEVKAIEPDGYMSIDESLSLDVCIKTIADKVYFIIRHLYPVIISKDDYNDYMARLNNSEENLEFLPVIEINDFEYDVLYELYKCQDNYQDEMKRVHDIDNALEEAKKYIKK